jgi:hypothetical protein
MNELSPRARALVDLASAHDGPTSADRARVRRAVTSSLAGGAILTSVAGNAAAQSAGLSLTKLAGWVALGGAVGLSAAVPLTSEQRAAAPAPLPDATARTPTAVVAAPAPAQPNREPQQTQEPAPAPARPAPAAVVSPVRSGADSLAAESVLLTRAQRELSSGNAAGAERALAEHAQRFPQGMLAEERRAVQAIALCEGGRVVEGERQAQAFLADHPNSPLAARVRSACKR